MFRMHVFLRSYEPLKLQVLILGKGLGNFEKMPLAHGNMKSIL
jgi:hypothetical protein